MRARTSTRIHQCNDASPHSDHKYRPVKAITPFLTAHDDPPTAPCKSISKSSFLPPPLISYSMASMISGGSVQPKPEIFFQGLSGFPAFFVLASSEICLFRSASVDLLALCAFEGEVTIAFWFVSDRVDFGMMLLCCLVPFEEEQDQRTLNPYQRQAEKVSWNISLKCRKDTMCPLRRETMLKIM